MRSPERKSRYPKEANDAYSAAARSPASARPRSQPRTGRRLHAHSDAAEKTARKTPVDGSGRIYGEAQNSAAVISA